MDVSAFLICTRVERQSPARSMGRRQSGQSSQWRLRRSMTARIGTSSGPSATVRLSSARSKARRSSAARSSLVGSRWTCDSQLARRSRRRPAGCGAAELGVLSERTASGAGVRRPTPFASTSRRLIAVAPASVLGRTRSTRSSTSRQRDLSLHDLATCAGNRRQIRRYAEQGFVGQHGKRDRFLTVVIHTHVRVCPNGDRRNIVS